MKQHEIKKIDIKNFTGKKHRNKRKTECLKYLTGMKKSCSRRTLCRLDNFEKLYKPYGNQLGISQPYY